MNSRLVARADDAEALIHRGWLFTQQKEWSEAIADLERFLRLCPGDSDALWLVGGAYLEAGQLTRALAAFGRVVEQSPEDREDRFRRGLLALALAQPGLAADSAINPQQQARGREKSFGARQPHPIVADSDQNIGIIGDDVVDPPLDQPVHLTSIVDGPHMHYLADAMGRPNQFIGNALRPDAESSSHFRGTPATRFKSPSCSSTTTPSAVCCTSTSA